MLRDRKSQQAFLNAAEMLAEAFSKSLACFADVDGGATAARDGIYQARRLTGESILDGNEIGLRNHGGRSCSPRSLIS